MPRSVRIGAGAGFADDRIDPTVELVERGDLDFGRPKQWQVDVQGSGATPDDRETLG